MISGTFFVSCSDTSTIDGARNKCCLLRFKRYKSKMGTVTYSLWSTNLLYNRIEYVIASQIGVLSGIKRIFHFGGILIELPNIST